MSSITQQAPEPQYISIVVKKEDVDYDKTEKWILKPGNVAAKTITAGPFQMDCVEFLKEAKCHKLTRPLTEEEMVALTDSIRLEGVRDSICLSLTGNIIDGYHRLKACCGLVMDGVPLTLPARVMHFDDTREEAEYVVRVNNARRQTTAKDRRKMAVDLLMDGVDWTDTYLGSVVALSQNTIRRIREDLEDSTAINRLDKRRDKRGSYHEQPRKKTKGCAKTEGTVCADDISTTTASTQISSDVGQTDWISSDPAVVDKAKSVSSAEEDCSFDPELVDELGDEDQANEECQTSESDCSPTSDESAEESFANPQCTNQLGVAAEQDPEEVEAVGKCLSSLAELILLIDKWWAIFGVEPISAQTLCDHLHDKLNFSSGVSIKGCHRQLGRKLSRLCGEEVAGYLLQQCHLGRSSIYYIRPAQWGKQGPQNQ